MFWKSSGEEMFGEIKSPSPVLLFTIILFDDQTMIYTRHPSKIVRESFGCLLSSQTPVRSSHAAAVY